MIHPAIRIVDVDPAGFAAVCAALAARDRRPAHEITIAHRDGVVRAVLDSAGELTPSDVGGARDAQALADGLHRDTGATVTVVDEVLLLELGPALTMLARECRSQGELLWRARRLWQGHAAVATAPEPAPARWSTLAALLAEVADGSWVVVDATDDGGSVCFTLGGEVRGGLLVTITSATPAGPVAVRLRCPAPVLDGILRSDDPAATLAEMQAEGRVTIEGLPVHLA